jgi:hypothetical protein
MTPAEEIAMLKRQIEENNSKLRESESKLNVSESKLYAIKKKYEENDVIEEKEENDNEEKEENDNEEKEENDNEEEKNEEVLTQRKIILYKNDEILDINDDKTAILAQIKKKHRKYPIYDNQKECSKSIVDELHNRKIINVMLLALTQSGKTGTMSALIQNYLADKDNIIPIENIYIITGLSSLEWIEQTKERMPVSIQERIFHRGNLNRAFINDIKKKKNVLIIIDEIQVAAKENQSLHIAFDRAGFYDKQNLLKNDIKIVEFTATPDGTIYDLMSDTWGDNASKILMQPGQGYTSCFDMFNNDKVKQYKDLCCYDKKTDDTDNETLKENINEIIDDINRFDSPMYHIISTPTGYKSKKVIENFKKFYNNEVQYFTYQQDSNDIEHINIMEDINEVLKIEPEMHTFIFIKEKLRCAKTLTKSFLGIVYERFTSSPDDAAIIQGLIGRVTGYDSNNKIICYTNKFSIEKYKKLWDSDFEDKSVKWKSKTTKMKEGCLISKGTYNVLPSDGSSSGSVSSDSDSDMWFHEWKELSYADIENHDERSVETLLEYVNNWIKEKPSYEHTRKNKRGNKYRLKNEIKRNDKTFYESSYTKSREILSYNNIKDVMLNIDNGLSKKTTNLPKGNGSCRTYITYKDIQDNESITFIIRYLERL